MSEITCARCGCEGAQPWVSGTNFCGKCATPEDLKERNKQLENTIDLLLARLSTGFERRRHERRQGEAKK